MTIVRLGRNNIKDSRRRSCMSVKKRVLGRGLDALLGTEHSLSIQLAEPPVAPSALFSLPVIQLRPNPFQPRHRFTPEHLEELTASIQEKGILQPLIVRKTDHEYEIVAGERRWRAAQQAGLQEVP